MFLHVKRKSFQPSFLSADSLLLTTFQNARINFFHRSFSVSPFNSTVDWHLNIVTPIKFHHFDSPFVVPRTFFPPIAVHSEHYLIENRRHVCNVAPPLVAHQSPLKNPPPPSPNEYAAMPIPFKVKTAAAAAAASRRPRPPLMSPQKCKHECKTMRAASGRGRGRLLRVLAANFNYILGVRGR